MNETVQILQDLVRNARTGKDSVEALMRRTGSPEMRGELNAEREQYDALMREAEQALRAEGGEPEPVGALSQAGMKLGLEFSTLTDRSDDHLAEMVIQGATMGIIEMTKSLNTYADAQPQARGLASRFIVQQNGIIERQKAFLENLVRA